MQLQFKLTQHFDEDGSPQGFSVTLEGDVYELENDDLSFHVHNLEILRHSLLTTGFTSNHLYQNLCYEIQQKRDELNMLQYANQSEF